MRIYVDGVPVVISASYVTGDKDSFFGHQFVAEYQSMTELNKDMIRLIDGIPSNHWRLEIDFQDKI